MKKYGKFHKLLSVPGTEGIPLTVVQGAAAGRTVLVSAGVHSLEEVGVQALIRLAAAMDPAHVAGRILFAHCCNLSGFFLHSNGCVPSDGKNLNHCLPGAPDGTEAERLASAIVNRLLSLSDAVIDLHSGGGYEALLPHAYIQADADPSAAHRSRELSAYANMPYCVASSLRDGLYSYAAVLGKTGVLIERGQCGTWSDAEAEAAAQDVRNMLRFLRVLRDGPEPVRYVQTFLPRAEYAVAGASGCWYPRKKPGDLLISGEIIGEIRDFYETTLQVVRARFDAVLLYQTVSLAIRKGDPMVAYASKDAPSPDPYPF